MFGIQGHGVGVQLLTKACMITTAAKATPSSEDNEGEERLPGRNAKTGGPWSWRRMGLSDDASLVL